VLARDPAFIRFVTEKDTVSTYFVGAALARLPNDGRLRVLKTAGIPVEISTASSARVTAESFAALWLAVSREMDDEFFGLDSRRMKVGSFAMLCNAVLHNPNLDKALKASLRGFGLYLDDITAELRLEDRWAVIAIDNRITSPRGRLFAEETLLVMVHGLMCWLAGRRIPIALAEFGHSQPAHSAEYAVMFSQRLRFDAPRTCLRFEGSYLGAPVVQNASSLGKFLRTAPQSVFLKYRNEDSWMARLRRALRRNVGDGEWPSLDAVASQFNLTPTTLRRRLESEGTTFQEVKDQLRRDLAVDRLCNSATSVGDIAAELGFKEPSAFHRAFKKWTGVQPGEYRLQQRRPTPT